MATSGTGFRFTLPEQVTQRTNGALIQVTTISGGELPLWLQFVPETNGFVASAVPAGGFPLRVVVIVEGKRTVIEVSERDG